MANLRFGYGDDEEHIHAATWENTWKSLCGAEIDDVLREVSAPEHHDLCDECADQIDQVSGGVAVGGELIVTNVKVFEDVHIP